MALTMEDSSGCTSLTRPSGMNLPGAVATTEILPAIAQINSASTKPMMLHSTQRLAGEGGVSWISSSGDRNSRSRGVNAGRSSGDSMCGTAELLGKKVVVDSRTSHQLLVITLL